MTRKLIQIATIATSTGNALIAAWDDGTVWRANLGAGDPLWYRLPSVPQSKPEQPAEFTDEQIDAATHAWIGRMISAIDAEYFREKMRAALRAAGSKP